MHWSSPNGNTVMNPLYSGNVARTRNIILQQACDQFASEIDDCASGLGLTNGFIMQSHANRCYGGNMISPSNRLKGFDRVAHCHRAGAAAALAALIACGISRMPGARKQRHRAARLKPPPATARASISWSMSAIRRSRAARCSARGATEYEFNLRLAQQIVQALLDQGFAKTTLLITEDPKRSGLLTARRARQQDGGRSVPVDPPQFGAEEVHREVGVRGGEA